MSINFRERERERNSDLRNIGWLRLTCTPTRDWTHNLGVCPDQNRTGNPFGLQDYTPTN